MIAWLNSRAREASTHFGAALVAASTFAASAPDDVADAMHDLTGGSVGKATVRVAAALVGVVGGVLIGTPAKP